MTGYSMHSVAHLAQTNLLLRWSTGNYIIDTLLGCGIAFLFSLGMNIQFNKIFSKKYLFDFYNKYKIKSYFICCAKNDKRRHDGFSETFKAISDWFKINIENFDRIKGVRELVYTNQFYDNINTFKTSDDIEINIILDQEDSIQYKGHDIWLEHTHVTDNVEDNYDGEKINREVQKYTWKIFSYTLTNIELKQFIMNTIITPYKLKLKKENDTKQFYYIYKNYNKEEQYLEYMKYEYNTTKTFKNIVSDHVPEVEKRIDFFTSNKSYYEENGIPYSLGFLFHGKSGCGKTSTLKAIAEKTKRHIKEIPLNQIKSKEALLEIFYNQKIRSQNVLQSNTIFVLDEIDKIDTVISKDDKSEISTNDTHSKIIDLLEQTDKVTSSNLKNQMMKMVENDKDTLTLADVLNIMDGMLELNGCIIVMIANDISKLREELIRPGRIDMIVEFNKCTGKNLLKLVKNHYNLPDYKLPDKYKLIDINKLWTPAEIQNICLINSSINTTIELLFQKKNN